MCYSSGDEASLVEAAASASELSTRVGLASLLVEVSVGLDAPFKVPYS